jgi:hypothetical protein
MESFVTPRLEVLAVLTEDGVPPEPPDDAVDVVLEEFPLLHPAAAMKTMVVAARALIRMERRFQAR